MSCSSEAPGIRGRAYESQRHFCRPAGVYARVGRNAFFCGHALDAFHGLLVLLPWRKVRSPEKLPVEKASFVHDTIYLVFFALLANGRHASCDDLVSDAPRFAVEKHAAQIVSGDEVLCPVLARVEPVVQLALLVGFRAATQLVASLSSERLEGRSVDGELRSPQFVQQLQSTFIQLLSAARVGLIMPRVSVVDILGKQARPKYRLYVQQYSSRAVVSQVQRKEFCSASMMSYLP